MEQTRVISICSKRKQGYFSIVFLLGLILSACAAPTTPRYADVAITLRADGAINDGVLLPIDVIAVSDLKSDGVLAISPDLWFGNDMRERLTAEEIQKLALRDGGNRQVTLRVPSTANKIIIYADYENVSERIGQQIVILAGKGTFQDHYLVRVHNNRLELMP